MLTDERETAGLAALEQLAADEAALYARTCQQLHDSAVLSARLQGPSGVDRFLVLELASTLRCGQVAAAHRLADASRLVEVLTHTLTGLETGRVHLPQARLVQELTRHCSEQVAAAVDARLHTGPDGPLALAGWTARRLRDRLRRLVLHVQSELEPDETDQAERTARDARRVSVRPEPDGMASLWALLPAEQLCAFTAGLDELHRRQLIADRATGTRRTADQRRADLLAMLPALALHALDGTPTGATGTGGGPVDRCSPKIVVNVHVPVATALGLSDAPALLDGHGPISADHLRRLLLDAHLRRVLVDGSTGQPLHVDRHLHAPPRPARGLRQPARTADVAAPGGAAHSPPLLTAGAEAGAAVDAAGGAGAGAGGAAAAAAAAAPAAARDRLLALVPDGPVLLHEEPEPRHDPSTSLARLVRTRDPLCTGPGCSTSSAQCDLDHEDPWPHGPTHSDNLRPRSRRCHRAKTLSWTVARHPDGTHTWTAPSTRSYTVPPYWTPPPTPEARPARTTPATTAPATTTGAGAGPGGTGHCHDLTHDLVHPGPSRSPVAAVRETVWPVDPPF